MCYRREGLEFDGRIFMESAYGVAVASLGQLAEGYTVVFGSGDSLNLRMLKTDERRDFLGFLVSVRNRVERRFGPAVIFEHGASLAQTAVSCGVNQMHVHIVPFSGHLLKQHLESNYKCTASFATIEAMLERLREWEEDAPYFWIQEDGGVFLFSYGDERKSQLVRRVIAKQLGLDDRWNWREHPTRAIAQRVAKELSKEHYTSDGDPWLHERAMLRPAESRRA